MKTLGLEDVRSFKTFGLSECRFRQSPPGTFKGYSFFRPFRGPFSAASTPIFAIAICKDSFCSRSDPDIARDVSDDVSNATVEFEMAGLDEDSGPAESGRESLSGGPPRTRDFFAQKCV